jgi:hypothetical protein
MYVYKFIMHIHKLHVCTQTHITTHTNTLMYTQIYKIKLTTIIQAISIILGR